MYAKAEVKLLYFSTISHLRLFGKKRNARTTVNAYDEKRWTDDKSFEIGLLTNEA